jgi:iron complex transport system permease protein
MIENQKTYEGYIRYKKFFILLLGGITILIALLAISAGSAGLPLREVVATLLGNGSEQSDVVVFNIRMPRAITAIVGGSDLPQQVV